MLNAAEADISFGAVEAGHGIFAVRVFAAIEAAAGEQAGEFGDGDPEKLLMKDMVDALLQIGDLVF